MPFCCPELRKENITHLGAEELRALGVQGILLDADNTLTTHKSEALAPGVADWLSAMREEGFALMLTSNAKRERILPFAEKLGLPCEGMCGKPLPGGLHRAADRLGLPPGKLVLIGDQVFTDLWGGKLAGIKTVLVTPWQKESGRAFRFKRWLERPFILYIDRKMNGVK